VSRGRKERHACNMIRTCSNGKMESSCASATPVREPENIKAAEKAREQETNASNPLAAPEATKGRETNAPFPRETAKSTRAQETNVPEEKTAAVRRDKEPLTSAAKERWQKEAAADRDQAAGEEQPPPPIGEETRFVPLSATDPECELRDTVSADR
jgi:Ca2+-dependent lipid-binding protein